MLQGTSFATRLVLQTPAEDSGAPFTFSRFEIQRDSPGRSTLLDALDQGLSWPECASRWTELILFGRSLAATQMRADVLRPEFDVRIVSNREEPPEAGA
jgi:hypothetical protein